MATLRAIKKVVTTPPTVRSLASGAPCAPLVNLRVRAPQGEHGHNDGHGTGPRQDAPASWASGVRITGSGFASKSFVTRASGLNSHLFRIFH